MKEEYLGYLKSDSKSQNTIENYIRYINEFINFINKDEIEATFNDMVQYKEMLSHKNLAPASINIRIASVKSYYDWLRRSGNIVVDPMIDAKVVKNNHPKTKEYVSPEDVQKIIDAMATMRGKAIVVLMANTGLRFAEMASITLEQYEEMKNLNKHYITIIGKGDKARKIFINDVCIRFIEMYLYNEKSKGNEHSKWLFETIGGKQMETTNLDKQLKEAARRANLPYADKFSAHWLRACFATNKLLNGAPITVVRDLMGHSSIAVTNRYLKTNDDMLEAYGLEGI